MNYKITIDSDGIKEAVNQSCLRRDLDSRQWHNHQQIGIEGQQASDGGIFGGISDTQIFTIKQ
ncbi:MAG: hypothetical protein LBV44_05750 [Methylobacillus sp.]|jgi:hypothetical protein|nr:hypothetical protein [Methylobacillus sp.]